MLNKEKLKSYFQQIRRDKFILILSFASLMGLLGILFFNSFIYATLFLFLPFIVAGRLKIKKSDAIKQFEAIDLVEFRYPEIYEIVRDLSLTANIDYVPKLYLIPSPIPNALAVGESENAGIGISEGLLDCLNTEELKGVLAHEIAHIKNEDHKILKITHIAHSMSSFISFLVNILILLSLPLILTGQLKISTIALVIVLLTPNFLQVLILGIMRNRELNADLTAVSITQGPEHLASALYKINEFQTHSLQKFFLHKTHKRDHWLDTHPSPIRRIKRLNKLVL